MSIVAASVQQYLQEDPGHSRLYLLQSVTLKASIPAVNSTSELEHTPDKFSPRRQVCIVVFAVNGGMITLSAACIRTLRRTTYVFERSISCRPLTNLILFAKEIKKPRHNAIREKNPCQVGIFMKLIKLILSLARILQKLNFSKVINIGVLLKIVQNCLEIFEV